MEYNRKPQQCDDCPLSQEKVDKHDIILTLNCDGPSHEERDYKGRTTVDSGEVVSIDPEAAGKYGRAVCRNRGFALWLADAESSYIAQQGA